MNKYVNGKISKMTQEDFDKHAERMAKTKSRRNHAKSSDEDRIAALEKQIAALTKQLEDKNQ